MSPFVPNTSVVKLIIIIIIIIIIIMIMIIIIRTFYLYQN